MLWGEKKCVFPLLWGEKKCVFHQFVFYNPKTSKNRTLSLLFSDHSIRTLPKHHFSGENSSGYIIQTVSTQILSLFVTWITSLRTILIFLIYILCFTSLLVVSKKIWFSDYLVRLLRNFSRKSEKNQGSKLP